MIGFVRELVLKLVGQHEPLDAIRLYTEGDEDEFEIVEVAYRQDPRGGGNKVCAIYVRRID